MKIDKFELYFFPVNFTLMGVVIGWLSYPLIPSHLIVITNRDIIQLFFLVVALIMVIKYLIIPNLIERGKING